MKKVLVLISAAALVLASCSREVEEFGMETMNVSSSAVTKISVDESYKSVWNKGDEVSVFFDDLQNECWSYTGKDKAVSGTIAAYSRFRSLETGWRVALYPYSSEYTASGKTISGPVGVSRPTLAALSSDANLQFSYLTSMITLNFEDTVDILTASLRPYGEEKFATAASVSFEGDSVSLSVSGAADSLVLTPGVTNSLTFNFLPLNFSQGFYVRIQYADSTFQTVRYTQPISFGAGNLLDFKVVPTYFIPSLVLVVDFTKKTAPFAGFPEAGETAKSRRDSTYYLVQDGVSYPFKFHAGYFEYSTTHEPEYGYRITTTTKVTGKPRCLCMGRDSSYVKLPYIKGKHFRRYEVWTGNAGCGQRITLDSLGNGIAAIGPGTVEPGTVTVVDMDYYHRDVEQPVFLYVSSGGNMVVLRWKFYYQ